MVPQLCRAVPTPTVTSGMTVMHWCQSQALSLATTAALLLIVFPKH